MLSDLHVADHRISSFKNQFYKCRDTEMSQITRWKKIEREVSCPLATYFPKNDKTVVLTFSSQANIISVRVETRKCRNRQAKLNRKFLVH